MNDLVAFLTARLDEDETAARAADGPYGWEEWQREIWADMCTEDEAHYRRHTPTRVLREVQAKRARLHAYEDACSTYRAAVVAHARDASQDRSVSKKWLDTAAAVMGAREDAVKTDAAVYSDHPDYQPEWKP